MNRREFLKRLGISVVALPVVAVLPSVPMTVEAVEVELPPESNCIVWTPTCRVTDSAGRFEWERSEGVIAIAGW